MQKETTYWNHYKTNPRTKNTLIFFLMSGFYRTFESDAIIVSQLFWLKITIQEWLQTASFLEKSDSYFERLEDADYSYVALQINKDWNVSVLRKHEWSRLLEINIPFDIFQWLLDDLRRLQEKYSACTRLIQPIDLPFNNSEEYINHKTNLIKDFELKGNDVNQSD